MLKHVLFILVLIANLLATSAHARKRVKHDTHTLEMMDRGADVRDDVITMRGGSIPFGCEPFDNYVEIEMSHVDPVSDQVLKYGHPIIGLTATTTAGDVIEFKADLRHKRKTVFCLPVDTHIGSIIELSATTTSYEDDVDLIVWSTTQIPVVEANKRSTTVDLFEHVVLKVVATDESITIDSAQSAGSTDLNIRISVISRRANGRFDYQRRRE